MTRYRARKVVLALSVLQSVYSRQAHPGRGYWLYMTEPGTLCATGA